MRTCVPVDYLQCFKNLLVFSRKSAQLLLSTHEVIWDIFFLNCENDSNYCNLSDIQTLSEYSNTLPCSRNAKYLPAVAQSTKKSSYYFVTYWCISDDENLMSVCSLWSKDEFNFVSIATAAFLFVVFPRVLTLWTLVSRLLNENATLYYVKFSLFHFGNCCRTNSASTHEALRV